MTKTLAIIATLGTLAGLLVAETARNLEMQLKAAQHKAQVEGDLKGAIEDYKKLTETTDRAIRAKAMLGMADCYQTLGKVDANKLYERVAREFPDQFDLAAEAMKRLSALDRPAGKTVSEVWEDASASILGAPSSDGSYITLTDADTHDLSVRDLSTGVIRHITANKTADDGGAEDSIPSPDGKLIAYGWYKNGHGDLRVIQPDGAGMRILYNDPAVRYVELYDWSPDSKNLVVVLQKENHQKNDIALISVADRTIRVIKADLPLPHADGIRFSPDGRYLVYEQPQAKDARERDVFVMAADGSGPIPLDPQPSDDYVLGWADAQHVLFASDRTSGTISAWSVRVVNGKPQGAPALVKPDLGAARPLGPAMAKRGFYYSINTAMKEVFTAELDPVTGKVVTQPAPAPRRFVGGNTRPLWSPDGTKLAYLSQHGQDADTGFAILDVVSGKELFFTPHLPNMVLNSWMPDGQGLAATSRVNARESKLQTIDAANGTVTARTGGPLTTPDGKWRLPVISGTLFARNPQTREEKTLYSVTGDECFCYVLPSPDSTQVAVMTNHKILGISIAGGAPRTLTTISPNDPQEIAWAGGYVLFIKKGKDSNELWRVSSAGGAPQKLDIAMPGLVSVSVHPDGRRIAFQAGVPKSDVRVLENFLEKEN